MPQKHVRNNAIWSKYAPINTMALWHDTPYQIFVCSHTRVEWSKAEAERLFPLIPATSWQIQSPTPPYEYTTWDFWDYVFLYWIHTHKHRNWNVHMYTCVYILILNNISMQFENPYVYTYSHTCWNAILQHNSWCVLKCIKAETHSKRKYSLVQLNHKEV